MNAIALVIPQFPANVRSDTYAVDYGRICGAEWMQRSAAWYAPESTTTPKETEMTKDLFADVADRVTGEEHGLDDADAVTVVLIAAWVQKTPALNTIAKVGLTAIAELSKTDPDLARSLAAEL